MCFGAIGNLILGASNETHHPSGDVGIYFFTRLLAASAHFTLFIYHLDTKTNLCGRMEKMDAPDVGDERPLKKTKTVASNGLQSQPPKRHRIKAKLSGLPYLPLDVLHEVCPHAFFVIERPTHTRSRKDLLASTSSRSLAPGASHKVIPTRFIGPTRDSILEKRVEKRGRFTGMPTRLV